VDLSLVIPDRTLSLEEGAIEPFTKPQFEWWRGELKKFARRRGISMSAPFEELSQSEQRLIIHGEDDTPGAFPGVLGLFDWLETKKYKLHVRVLIAKYRGYTICGTCQGGRLRPEAQDVRICGKTLPEVCRMSIREAAAFFEAPALTAEHLAIAERLLAEVRARLRFMLDVGLDYLTLDRLASTLSGGEAQRIQLATHLGSSLVGALYVLDEPSIGLHPRDSDRLIRLLQNLRDIGNTVLVVEHEAEMMRAADHILDIGPGAGELGGEVVFEGTYQGLLTAESSLTGKYLRGECQVSGIHPLVTRKVAGGSPKAARQQIVIRGARA
jgi:excinuclease ABC subunit A